MDDTTFFDAILPSSGLRCAAVVLPSGKWMHHWGPSNAWLAAKAAELDTVQNKDVYYGCASYTPKALNKPSIGGGRKQINVLLVRAFWADLDVGLPEEGKRPKYATAKLAAAAVFKFATDHGLPLPWLVRSGYGLHAYWPTDTDMTVEQWKPLAEALKRALTAAGVLFDPSRTADEASVLRPPGTRNHKFGATKPVVLAHQGKIIPMHVMAKAVAGHVQATVAAGPGSAKLGPKNAALGGGMEPDPSSAHMIADKCAVIGVVRDTRGNVEEPTWYNVLGVLQHTIEAPAICHEWSEGHAEYEAAKTDTKLSQLASHGPTTCAKIADFQGPLCHACPYWGDITSPIQLGRPRVEKAKIETVETVIGPRGFVKEVVAKVDLPYGFGEAVEEGRRVLTYTTIVRDETGAVKDSKTAVIANTLFWGLSRLWMDGTTSQVEFEMLTREGSRKFVVDSALIGRGGREIMGELAKNEIVAVKGGAPHLQAYLGTWLAHLTKTADQVLAHRSFGWAGTDFVLGDTVVRPDGSETRAILGGMARDKQDAVGRKGDLATWVALVDRAYNAPGQEAFQFQLGCAFGAPLLSLMQQVRGVTVYSHSDGSGVGKTTVQQVGLSAWGDWDAMMLAQNKATAGSLWALLGAYNSLPIVYDELTNAPKNDISELVFSVSSGRAKERLTAAGTLRANNSNWSTIMLASGNTLLSEKLAQHRANAEAEISRLFEFTLTAAPHLTVTDANALFPQFRNHYGHAGHAFARFVTANRERVQASLHAMQEKLVAEFEMTQVERHWSALFASVLVAIGICRGLGLMSFEVKPVKAWMRQQLDLNRGGRTSSVTPPEDLISEMLDDLWPDVLVTKGWGDVRKGVTVNVEKHPRNVMVGRRVLESSDDKAALLISRTAISEWCAKKTTSPAVLFKAGLDKGWLDPKIDRHTLGKGVKAYQTSNIHCWRFFPDAMDDGVIPNVIPLGMVAGGKP